MLCVSLKNRVRACGPTTGGVSDIAIFDPFDFNFSQVAPVDGVAQKYSAVALRPGASGSGGTAATATVTITNVGSDGDAIAIYFAGTLLGTFTKTGTETTVTLLAAALVGAINSGTSTHGFSASNVAGVITVTAPVSYGAVINTQHLIVDDGGGIVAGKTAFTGGVTGAGGKVFLISFKEEECEYTFSRADSTSSSYEHLWSFQLEDNDQSLTQLYQAIDAASYCCGLGMIYRLNSGKIFVAGERFVNGAEIPRYKIKHANSDGTSGKVYEDFNGANTKLKGKYSRLNYEYSGTWASITALM